MLSVAPERQNSGIGRHLMTEAETYCQERGCLAADLRAINRRTELIATYERLGYIETGTEQVPAAALGRFRLPCHFVTMSKQLSSG